MHRDFYNRNDAPVSQNQKGDNENKNDTFLLLALIYLLIKDGADRGLILALVYILM